jgi:hypothetical protein
LEEGCNECWYDFEECPCDPAELESILREPYGCSVSGPCIDPIFGPTKSHYYWTSTTLTNADFAPLDPLPYHAWFVVFSDGWVSAISKNHVNHVRAVRDVP